MLLEWFFFQSLGGGFAIFFGLGGFNQNATHILKFYKDGGVCCISPSILLVIGLSKNIPSNETKQIRLVTTIF